MIVSKVLDGEFVSKIFSTQIGFHYKIYKVGSKIPVAQSYVYYHRYNDCADRMFSDLEILKINI